ncbi:hypothetical protein [Corynebacterium sp.]|uniref:hypothetical protein n=1 Tax=Corynebacterium sp. TaxID=1720 RepID=UPI0026DD84B8|nr:hypothetical protein [Corynebacterium sp.]MDO4610309.1 hypothetical protein [Corynebacterium sp.]
MADHKDRAFGLYQKVYTQEIEQWRNDVPGAVFEFTDITDSDAPHVLGKHVGEAVTRMLVQVPPDDRQEVVNGALRFVEAAVHARRGGGSSQTGHDEESVVAMQELVEVRECDAPALSRPLTPLTEASLLTNAMNEPRVGRELSSEMRSADRVDVLMAFVKYAGVTLLAVVPR